jgi:carboxylesterase
MGEELVKRGFRAVSVTLPGHCTTLEELLQTRHTDWLEAVTAAFQNLRAESEHVFIAGVSLGGLLSLALASRFPAQGVAVVGVPFDFGWHVSWIPGLLKSVRRYMPKSDGAGIMDPDARARHASYPLMPIASVAELIRLQRVVRSEIHALSAPLLVAYGRHDRTASPANAELIFDRVSSNERQHLVLDNSAHIATLDYDGEQLCQSVADFFEAQLPPTGA